MLSINTFAHSDFLYNPGKDLSKLFFAGIARRVAISFLSFFSAVFIYQLYVDGGFTQRNAMYIVLLFYILLVAFKQAFLSVSEDLSQKIGFTGTMRLSFIPFVILILSLIFAESYPSLVFVAGIAWGIHAGLFWWGYHGYFIKKADSSHFGEGLGESEMLKTVVTIIAPVLGAVVIDVFGFQVAFLLSGLAMLVGVITLGDDKEVKQKHDIKYKDAIGLIFKHKSVAAAYFANGAEAVIYTVIWSLFLYFFFNGVLGMGIVVSISLFLSAIFAIFIGKKIDKSGERKVLAVGSPLFSLSWIMRIFASNPFSFILSDGLRNFSDKMVSLPLMELSYKKGVEDYTSKAILFREIAIGFGALVALLVVFVFISLGLWFVEIFVLTAVLILLPLIPIFSKKI